MWTMYIKVEHDKKGNNSLAVKEHHHSHSKKETKTAVDGERINISICCGFFYKLPTKELKLYSFVAFFQIWNLVRFTAITKHV